MGHPQDAKPRARSMGVGCREVYALPLTSRRQSLVWTQPQRLKGGTGARDSRTQRDKQVIRAAGSGRLHRGSVASQLDLEE